MQAELEPVAVIDQRPIVLIPVRHDRPHRRHRPITFVHHVMRVDRHKVELVLAPFVGPRKHIDPDDLAAICRAAPDLHRRLSFCTEPNLADFISGRGTRQTVGRPSSRNPIPDGLDDSLIPFRVFDVLQSLLGKVGNRLAFIDYQRTIPLLHLANGRGMSFAARASPFRPCDENIVICLPNLPAKTGGIAPRWINLP